MKSAKANSHVKVKCQSSENLSCFHNFDIMYCMVMMENILLSNFIAEVWGLGTTDSLPIKGKQILQVLLYLYKFIIQSKN